MALKKHTNIKNSMKIVGHVENMRNNILRLDYSFIFKEEKLATNYLRYDLY